MLTNTDAVRACDMGVKPNSLKHSGFYIVPDVLKCNKSLHFADTVCCYISQKKQRLFP